MAIQIKTEEYEWSHGRKPRGRGLWIFEGRSRPNDQPIVIKVNDSYRFAVAEAKRRMLRDFSIQDGSLNVCP